jgi:hypothetical protein
MAMTKKFLTIILTLVLVSLSCNLPFLSSKQNTAIPQDLNALPTSESFPQQTNTPKFATPIVTQPQTTYERAQVGLYSNLYLTYDPSIWEAYTDPAWAPNSEGQTIYSLNHKKHNCILEANLGMGAPETWQRFVSGKRIGKLDYQVETWRDTTTNMEVLVVYQYPADGQRENSVRIEVVINDHPQECIADTEAVLALSEEEIR